MRTKTYGQHSFSYCIQRQRNSLPSEVSQTESSHDFKTALKQIKLPSPNNTNSFSFCPPPPPPPINSVHLCVHVCGVQEIKHYIYILLLRLYLYIFVDLKSAVCSPLSVRYGAIEMTAIIIIISPPVSVSIISIFVVADAGLAIDGRSPAPHLRRRGLGHLASCAEVPSLRTQHDAILFLLQSLFGIRSFDKIF